MPVSRCAGWQRLLVIADAVFIKERLIDEVFSDHHIRQRIDQRRIGTRADRDPLVFSPRAGIGVARIDDDHSCVGFGARLLKIIGYPTAAHTRFARVVAEQHHQLAVFYIRRAVTVCPAAIGVVQARGNLCGRVVAIMVEIAAAAVHQARYQRFTRRPGAGHGAAQRPGAIVQVDGFVAVFFDQALHVGRDNIVGFVPANALELPFPTLTDTLHRIFQTIRVINATAH
ncbi:Uncharacterised protein [Enterobacter hormaechei]|nr:Uncharacterised protein [Enterobacter hormaechei]